MHPPSPNPSNDSVRPDELCPACGRSADRPGLVARADELVICDNRIHDEFRRRLEVPHAA